MNVFKVNPRPAVPVRDQMAPYWQKFHEPIHVPNRDINVIRKRLEEKVELVKWIDANGPQYRLDTTAVLNSQQRDLFSGDYTDDMSVPRIGNMGDVLNISDAVSSSTTIHIFDTAVLSPTQRLEELRTSGLPKAIDWNRLEYVFSGLSHVQLTDKSLHPETVITQFASRYVAIQNQIARDFSGAEQEENLHQLDAMYATYTEAYAKNLSNELGGLFEASGVGGERTKVEQSVRDSLLKKTEQYAAYSRENPDYAPVEHPQDSWLLRCSDYMASQLRAAAEDPVEDAIKTDGVYSMDELGAVYDYAMAGVHLMRFSFDELQSKKDEGAKAAVMLLSARYLGEKLGVSEQHQDALKSALEGKLSRAVKNKTLMERTVSETMQAYDTSHQLSTALETIFHVSPGIDKNAVSNYVNTLFARFDVI